VLIEELAATAQTVQSALVAEGYLVLHIPPGPDALRQILAEEPDLVIVGVHSPTKDWRWLGRLLAVLECPVFVLLGDGDEVGCARALELGADECMAQPLRPSELVARVRHLLRRGRPRASRREQSFFVDRDLAVDLTRHEAHVCDEPVALTATEWRILTCLILQEGEVVSRERLITQVWGRADGSSDDSLRQHIHHLRRKLEPDPQHPRRIVALRGEGYQLRRLNAKGARARHAASSEGKVSIEPVPLR
jgi:DNA-binding response OmpR family regulator